jgi:hypothetical protein
MHHLILALNLPVFLGTCIWHLSSSALMCIIPHIIGKTSLCFLHVYSITHCCNSWEQLFFCPLNDFWDEFKFPNLSFICHHLRTLHSATPNFFLAALFFMASVWFITINLKFWSWKLGDHWFTFFNRIVLIHFELKTFKSMLYTQLQSIQASKYHSGLCFSIANSEN